VVNLNTMNKGFAPIWLVIGIVAAIIVAANVIGLHISSNSTPQQTQTNVTTATTSTAPTNTTTETQKIVAKTPVQTSDVSPQQKSTPVGTTNVPATQKTPTLTLQQLCDGFETYFQMKVSTQGTITDLIPANNLFSDMVVTRDGNCAGYFVVDSGTWNNLTIGDKISASGTLTGPAPGNTSPPNVHFMNNGNVVSVIAKSTISSSAQTDYTNYASVSFDLYRSDTGAYLNKQVALVGMVNAFMPRGGSGGTTNYIQIINPFDQSQPKIQAEVDSSSTYSAAVTSLQDTSSPIYQFVRVYGTGAKGQTFTRTSVYGSATVIVPVINVTRIDKCLHGSMNTTVLTGSSFDDNFTCTSWTTIAGQ